MKLPNNRYSEIDLVKTISILSVVMIHVCSLGRYYYVGIAPWYATLFWRCVPAAAVPLFFMSNGVLLLDPNKELSLKKLFTVKLPRLLIPLFFWATAYMLFDLCLQNALTLSNVIYGIKEVLLFRHKYHLYFLHIMLLVYVFLPLTRFFLQKAGKKDLLYLLGLWFALGILYPTFSHMWPLNLVDGIPDQWALNLTYCAIGYSLVGYLMHRTPPSVPLCIGALLLGFAILFCATGHNTTEPGPFDDRFLQGNTLGIFLYATGFFGLCCRRKGKMKPLSQKLAFVGAEASFCIYLVHVFFISLFVRWELSPDTLPRILSLPLLALLATALSALVYVLLSRIPIVKKWLI